MKKITETKTIEEVKGYEANDGTFFKDADECKKYEESAKGIIMARLKQYKIYEGDHDDLYDDLSCECRLEIYDIRDAEASKTVAQYMNIESGDNSEVLLDKYIGQKLIVFWNYDHDYCWWNTIDEFVDGMKTAYNRMIADGEKGE